MIALGGLGLGTAPIGGLYEAVEDETAHAVIERAWALGLRYFDTAPLYGAGMAERRLGGALRGKPREEFAVSTKVGRSVIGVGANQPEVLCRFAREADPDCFLVAGRYTVLDRTAADELLPLCEEHGIAVIAGGVFNSRVLAGGDTFDYATAPPEVLARVRRLRETCARHGVPLPAAAVQFPPRHPAVATVLVGCRTAEEVAENVGLSTIEIPDSLWDDLT